MSNLQRFILLPPRGTGDFTAFPGAAAILSEFRSESTFASLRIALNFGRAITGQIRVLDSIHEYGAKLVEMPMDAKSILHTAAPGIRIVPEVFYRMSHVPRMTIAKAPARDRKDTAKRGGRRSTSTHVATSVRLTVRIGKGAAALPAAGVYVVAFTNFAAGEGAEGETDRSGTVTLRLPEGTKAERIYFYPAHSGWSLIKKSVVLKAGLVVNLRPIDFTAADGVQALIGRGKGTEGAGVTVGVVDTGVGPHVDLPVAGGLNTVSGESADDWRDNGNGVGHGTHVAGIIGAQGPAGRLRGVAPGVSLHSYRVFGAGQDSASSFAIAKAIIRAAEQGCDLINLSLGGGPADEATLAAINDARARGAVVLAATGNDGRQPVSYPARYGMALAVSACGRKGTFPADSVEATMAVPPYGTDRKNFIADFSNVGPETDLVGPGVGIVSTFPEDRFAVESGTSMACPAVCGAAARILAANPRILGAARDQARSDAIARLLLSSARSLGFPAHMEGAGLPTVP